MSVCIGNKKDKLEIIGGEKHANPHYDIKAENSSCYPISKYSTEIDINEMLCCIDKQREQLNKAKEIIKDFMLVAKVEHLEGRYETVDEAEKFLNSSLE